MMFQDVEKQLLSGLDKKEHDKEKKKVRKMWIKLNKKKVCGQGEGMWTRLSEARQECGRNKLEECKELRAKCKSWLT